jgi:hypothetical protein
MIYYGLESEAYILHRLYTRMFVSIKEYTTLLYKSLG